MKRPFNFRIASLILLSIVLAILAITFCSSSIIFIFIAFTAIALLSVIFIKRLKKARPKLTICILIFLITLGLTQLNFIKAENRQIYSENSLIEASIDMLSQCNKNGEIQLEEKGREIEICLNNITVNGVKIDGKAKAVFSDKEIFKGFKIGDRIKFRGNIAPKNLVVTDSFSVFDYRNKLYHYIFCNVDFDNSNFCFYKVSSQIKLSDKIKLRVKSALYSNTREDTAGFLYAMTFGDKSGLSSQIKSSFSYTGTAHVFAVSGLHVGILAGSILWIFKKFKLNNRIIKLSIMGAILLIFCALCDFSPSTVRASIMTIMLMTAKALGMRNDSISNMSLAASGILLVDPIYLFDIGFLMSFFAVFGIIALNKPIAKLFKKLPKKLSGLLSTSLSVNLTLLPLMMLFFNGQTLLFIIANLILLPVLAIFFPIYLFSIIISAIAPFMGWLITIVAAPFTLLIMFVEWVGKLPTLVINFKTNAVIILIALLSVVVLSQYVFTHKNIKRIAAAVFAVAFIFTMSTSVRIWGSNNLYVYCFTDSYDCQYILIDNAFGGEYLIVNDKTSGNSVSSVLDAMSENKFSKIDGIIVVGKVDEYYIAKLQNSTGCPYVYGSNCVGFESSGIYAGTTIVETGLTISFLNDGVIDIVSGKTTLRVVARDYSGVRDSNYEILVTYDIPSVDANGKYIVCDVGFNNSMENYVPSTFTFELNNDRIKVERSWRY